MPLLLLLLLLHLRNFLHSPNVISMPGPLFCRKPSFFYLGGLYWNKSTKMGLNDFCFVQIFYRLLFCLLSSCVQFRSFRPSLSLLFCVRILQGLYFVYFPLKGLFWLCFSRYTTIHAYIFLLRNSALPDKYMRKSRGKTQNGIYILLELSLLVCANVAGNSIGRALEIAKLWGNLWLNLNYSQGIILKLAQSLLALSCFSLCLTSLTFR